MFYVHVRVHVSLLGRCRWVEKDAPDYIDPGNGKEFNWAGNLRSEEWVATKLGAEATTVIKARPAPDFSKIRPPSPVYKSPIRSVIDSARKHVCTCVFGRVQ